MRVYYISLLRLYKVRLMRIFRAFSEYHLLYVESEMVRAEQKGTLVVLDENFYTNMSGVASATTQFISTPMNLQSSRP